MPSWYDDDELWKVLARLFFSQIRTDEITSTEVEQLLTLLQPGREASFLDLCCGPGRHALQLARRGFAVVGVDRTVTYLESARERAADQGLEIELVRADMREFRRREAFDCALNLFSSFGYFDDPADDLRVLRNLHDSLKPGGRLLMEMVGKEVLARGFEPRAWHRLGESEEYVLEERSLRDGWDWIDTRWTVIREGRVRTVTSGIRIYSGAELAGALREAGFSSVRLYGSLDGTPYDLTAQRLVALAARS